MDKKATFDPAVFVSFNFVEASAVIVGLDLAMVLRPDDGKPQRSSDQPLDDDFLGDDF